MNEELETTLAEMLTKAMEVASATGEFILEQAPDLLQQFFDWNIAKHSILMSVFLLTTIILLVLARKLFKMIKEEYVEDGLIGVLVIEVVVTIGFFIASIYQFSQLLKIMIAPKIYLIDYFVTTC